MNSIDKSTQYWLIRPGIEGKCFEDFYADSCVALGWDRIGDILLRDSYISLEKIKELVTSKYNDFFLNDKKSRNRKVGDIASKIYKFCYEVKVGDIILTPGNNEVIIGKVVGEVEIVPNKYNSAPKSEEEKLIGNLNKVREVQWIKRIKRDFLEPNIKLCLRTVHGISQIKQEQVITEINRTLYNFYEYKNLAHSIYRIKNETGIDFNKYAVFIACIKDVYDILDKEKTGKLVIKTNVQSPGPIELIGNIGIVDKINSAVKFILKNDNEELKKMGNHSEELRKLKKNTYANIDEEEYRDYDFPSSGTY